MSIGRIRSGVTTPTQVPAAPAPAAGAVAPFEVGRTEAAEPVAPTGPLGALRAGQVDRDGYLDAHVAQATAHLGGLPPAEHENVRAMLRERCDADPLLVDLIATATRPA